MEVPAIRRLAVIDRSPDTEDRRNRRALESSRTESRRLASTQRSVRARRTTYLTVLMVGIVSLWNPLILGRVVIAYPFMPTRHNYWIIENNHVPAKRPEAIQPCCHYITHALILLTCCLCSIVYSDEVANLCASISSLLDLSVAYMISDVTLRCFLAEKEQGEHKLLNRLQTSFLLKEDPSHPLHRPSPAADSKSVISFRVARRNLSLS
jgi:hypothetical protein